MVPQGCLVANRFELTMRTIPQTGRARPQRVGSSNPAGGGESNCLCSRVDIFEMNVESYRRRAALERKRGRGRPATHATITANA
jgi:hypothetical protein